MLRLLLAFALVAAALPAQRATTRRGPPTPATKAPAPDRWPLAAVHISGNKVFPTDAIVRATGLQLGAAVNKGDFQRALERLTATGAFETASFHYDPEGEKLAVTFEVQEVVDLYPVGFERLDVPDAELMKVLGERVPLFGPQAPATGVMVKRIIDTLEAYLAAKNQKTEIVGRVLAAPGSGGKLQMTFRPMEPPPVVTFVKFEGSTLLRAEDLQKAFFQTAVGVPYTEARLNELLENNIRLLFEEKGRLQVHFGPLRAEPSQEATGVVVTVPVRDGDEFHFGRVGIAGNAYVSPKELVRLAKLNEGELANFALVHKASADIERRCQREGYMHAKVTVERKLDEKAKTVDLVFRVGEGDRYTLRRLTIKGLDLIGEDAVRKRWAIKPGQPFDGAYPETFLQRIEEEGMFDQLGKTVPHVQVDEEKKAVDVELEFKAAAPAEKRRRRRPEQS